MHGSQGREDLEFRALIAGVDSGLDRFTARPADRSIIPNTGGGPLTLVLLAMAVIALPVRLAAASPPPEESSHVRDVRAFVDAGSSSSGQFLVATVRGTIVDPGRADDDMQRSQANAIEAALACTAGSVPDIGFRSDGVGGPSAGLMFALAIIDEIEDADITGGLRIAGTGTVSAAGVVGQVGAVGEKVLAAQRAGADLFFVPTGQMAEAVGSAETLRVIGVSHIGDALRALTGSACGSADV